MKNELYGVLLVIIVDARYLARFAGNLKNEKLKNKMNGNK